MKISLNWYARIGLALFIAVLVIAAMSGSAAAAGPIYHTVQPGQTLFWIAGHYGVSVWALACANGLYNPNYIYAGSVLYVPYGWYGGCKPSYKKPMYDDHKGYDKKVYYPKYPKYDDEDDCYYKVKWGDHLYRIALKYGTSWVKLAYANQLYNGNYIYAGQVLRIPGCN